MLGFSPNFTQTAEGLITRPAHPEALGETRQSARFLCGLTSPALTRAKLSRHPLFASLETHRFQQVLDLLTTGPSPPPGK